MNNNDTLPPSFNQSELAELLGVSRTTIKRYCSLPGAPARDEEKRYDLASFANFYFKNRPAQLVPEYKEQRTLKLAAERRLAEIKVEEAEKVLINAEEVERQWIEVATLVKSELLSQPQKIAPGLVQLINAGGEEAQVCTYLTKAFKDVLRHLAGGGVANGSAL